MSSYAKTVAMLSNETALGQFLGGYFHVDWMLDHQSTSEVVSYFLLHNPPEAISDVHFELREFLSEASTLSSETLQDLMFLVGAYYRCNRERRSAREWLSAILEQLENNS